MSLPVVNHWKRLWMPVAFVLFMAAAFDAYRQAAGKIDVLETKISQIENSAEGMLGVDKIFFGFSGDEGYVNVFLVNSSPEKPIEISKAGGVLSVNGTLVQNALTGDVPSGPVTFSPKASDALNFSRFPRSLFKGQQQIEHVDLTATAQYGYVGFEAKFEMCASWKCSFRLEELTSAPLSLCSKTQCVPPKMKQ